MQSLTEVCTSRHSDIYIQSVLHAGKSLCYQLPALLKDHGFTVVTPMVGQMRDQVGT